MLLINLHYKPKFLKEIIYDAEPTEDIQNSQYQLTTGILYSFN